MFWWVNSINLAKGSTFLSLTPNSNEKHLYFIITDPDENGKVVIVNLTKKHINSDDSCIIKKGEHPFAMKYDESVINYAEAVLIPIKNIENAIIQSPENFSKHSDIKDEILNRILFGAKISEFLPRPLWAVLKTWY